MTANDHFKTPVLSRVTIRESKSIGIMFRMYDSNSAGSISPHYARKLLKALGPWFNYCIYVFTIWRQMTGLLLSFNSSSSIIHKGLDSDTVDLPVTVSFRDFLIIVDKLVPPPNPPLRVRTSNKKCWWHTSNVYILSLDLKKMANFIIMILWPELSSFVFYSLYVWKLMNCFSSLFNSVFPWYIQSFRCCPRSCKRETDDYSRRND